MRRNGLLLALALFLAAAPARSQQPPRLAGIWDAYQQLDYERAADSARVALEAFDRYAPPELAQVHAVLGLIDFAGNDASAARAQFAAALSLDPDLRLDPLLVSPKTRAFFEEVRTEVTQTRPGAEPPPSVRYVVVEDRRTAAALRSMVLPGWGQLYKGHRTKGAVLTGLWSAAAGSMALAHLRRRDARQRYDEATTPEEATARYEPFNRWHRRRTAALYAAATIWAVGYVDALATRAAPPASRPLRLDPALGPGGRLHAAIRVRF